LWVNSFPEGRGKIIRGKYKESVERGKREFGEQRIETFQRLFPKNVFLI
jgi:hypothetical protein